MSTSRIYNDEARPRALLQDLPDDTAAEVERLFPKPRRVVYGEQVHEPEYDVLITSSAVHRDGRLHVVAFGPEELGWADGGEDLNPNVTFGTETTLANTLTVPESVKGRLGELVHRYLVPYFSALTAKPRLSFVQRQLGNVGGKLPAGQWCTPFLLASDGSVLAGAFTRYKGGRCWVLPKNCPAPELWVAAALKEFHELDPEAVPGQPDWWEQPEWATIEQQRARATVASLETQREKLLRDLDTELAVAREGVGQADAAAAVGSARLLTADGDELAHAVQTALEDLGFTVEDMDQVNSPGQRLEDLRVRDPHAHPGWEALVEVKGYTAGAKVNDLGKLLRWKAHYVKETRRDPDALWHVVNAFRQNDPVTRPVPIPSDEDLENLVAEGGVLIDTRDLFKAQRDVAAGAADRDEVRVALRSATGRWTHDPRAAADEEPT
ncbi:hypothetical protein AB0F91_39685 [Amycolatopsis sp. NPDC023774]|uniref:hypothetical protein n=1 Tax=Amycolatopsis sp. NPDC023774 TaxID=3155015 RepID=UPI0033ECEDD1